MRVPESDGGPGMKIAGIAFLMVLGVLGNYFSLPLFFGIDFILGSIAMLVAIRLHGPWAGVLVAVPAALYTIVLWGHMSSCFILICEALCMGWLASRLRYLPLADALFWIFIGSPAVILLYTFHMELPVKVVQLISLKLFVNGIANAAVASLIVIGLQALRLRRDISFSELLFNSLVLVILVPGMTLVSIDSRMTKGDLEHSISDKLGALGKMVAHEIISGHVTEASGDLDEDLQAAIAAFPLVEDIGLYLESADGTILAERGAARMGGSGTIRQVRPDLQIWLPEQGHMNVVSWWKQAKYFIRLKLSGLTSGMELVVTYDADPAIRRLEERNLTAFSILGALTCLTIILALFGTRLMAGPLEALGLASTRLADAIDKQRSIEIPGSSIGEFNALASKLREMAIALLKSYRTIEDGKKLSDNLLRNILPDDIAEELKATGSTTPRHFDQVTVMFTDFTNFTAFAAKLTPAELVAEIHTCFKEFDAIVSRHNLEKIKTIGDAYMCAGGLPSTNDTHAMDAVNAALEIRDFMTEHMKTLAAKGHETIGFRIGIHTGPVVAGVVGVNKFAYDIWGDTVNVASRAESSCEPGQINITSSTYELVRHAFTCIHRGQVHAKNRGAMDMYFVEGRRS